ncbi:hypothetical protein M0812_15181 [Anaeramoeba flamelloides]|uniref:Uncharacterized protein n=1 Tax=Anaeramoeba flamelloides TaxID=1746091 RepID=A0AAV7ZDE7_9EUKA|nr:hypothetical protein M0812_15181 [Anaeramoeba flamelloides]
MLTIKQNNPKPTFYSTLWKFGEFLASTLTTDQSFVPNEMINSFLETIQQQSDATEAKKCLEVIWRIFNQNCVVLLHEKQINKRKRKSKKIKKHRCVSVEEPEALYTLNSIWRPLMRDQKNITKITPFKPNPSQNTKLLKNSSRKQKTIGLLSLKMCKMLQKEPLTREKMETKTGFIKQRICTVLSVYKMVNLIEDDKVTSHLFWNSSQAQILFDLKKYLLFIIKLRNFKRKLCQRVSRLVDQYQTKIEEGQNYQTKLEGSSKKKNINSEKLFRQLTPFLSSVLTKKVNGIQFKEELGIQNLDFELGLFQKAIIVQDLIKKTKVILRNQKLQSDSIIENSKRFISKVPQRKNRRRARLKRKRIVTKLMRDKKKQQQQQQQQQQVQIHSKNQPLENCAEKNENEKEKEKEINNEKTIVRDLKKSNKEKNESLDFPSGSNLDFNQPTNSLCSQDQYRPNKPTIKETEAIEAILSLTFSTKSQENKLDNQTYSLIQKKNNHTHSQMPPLLLILQQYGNTLSFN